ncbi:methyltransferase domain-containing protein [Candidatus Woesearchaeota archaeon]|nr:methyltransferase domain-containing protein [Candidatus Woesearchaeota archaeon]
MKTYIFILGRDPHLSEKEIFSYLQARTIPYEVKEESNTFLVLKIKGIPINHIAQALGGTIKIGEVIRNLEDLPTPTLRKLKFAISVHAGEEHDLLSELKSWFKKQGCISTLKKPKKERYLLPTEVIKHHLLTTGLEIIIAKGNIARTVAVPNILEYAKRDKKPYFDNKKVISIRLAKMLLNYAMLKKGDIFLDPFCGTGTILQEAALLGVRGVGVDKDAKTLEGARKNISWLKNIYNPGVPIKLINHDARHVKLDASFDAVVTEPLLGPFLKTRIPNKQAQKVTADLSSLYEKTMINILPKLKKGGKVVIITPSFKTSDGQSVKVSNLFAKLPLKKDPQSPLQYNQSRGRIGREIHIFTK